MKKSALIYSRRSNNWHVGFSARGSWPRIFYLNRSPTQWSWATVISIYFLCQNYDVKPAKQSIRSDCFKFVAWQESFQLLWVPRSKDFTWQCRSAINEALEIFNLPQLGPGVWAKLYGRTDLHIRTAHYAIMILCYDLWMVAWLFCLG